MSDQKFETDEQYTVLTKEDLLLPIWMGEQFELLNEESGDWYLSVYILNKPQVTKWWAEGDNDSTIRIKTSRYLELKAMAQKLDYTTKRPRFFGNEPFGDGLCPRVWLGDDLSQVQVIVKEIMDHMWEEYPEEELRIWVEYLTDFEVEKIPDL